MCVQDQLLFVRMPCRQARGSGGPVRGRPCALPGAATDGSTTGAPYRDNRRRHAKLASATDRVMGDKMDWTERRERFRALLAGDRCVHTGSVYDAISARIAEELGLRGRHLLGLDRLDGGARRPRSRRDDLDRVRRAGLPRLPRRQPLPAGRCRSRLRQRAQRAPHGRGAGDLGCLRALDRGHGAAASLRSLRQADPDPGRGGDRQDEGGLVGAPGQEARESPAAPAHWR